MARREEPFPYASGEDTGNPSPPRHVTTASVLVVLGVMVLVTWLGRGPGPGESAGAYYAKLLLFALLGELVLLVVAALLTGLTRADAARREVALRAGTCLLIATVFLGWAAFLAARGWLRGEHGLAFATALLLLGTLDLLVLSLLCFLQARPAIAWLRLRPVRALALFALPFWIVPGCLLLCVPTTHGHPHHSRCQCLNNVRMICTILDERAHEHGWPPFEGKNFVLSLVADGVIEPGFEKNLEIFFCPRDAERLFSDIGVARYRELTPAALRERRFPELTSYAGPLLEGGVAAHASRVVPILGCRHHSDHVVIGYSDGTARSFDRSDLGLEPGEAIVFGPGSTSPLLRGLSEE